jgi:hypothetical protein
MKCKSCGHWNYIEVETGMLKIDNHEPKVQVLLPSYLPFRTEVCSKCRVVIAEPKEIIRIVKNESNVM